MPRRSSPPTMTRMSCHGREGRVSLLRHCILCTFHSLWLSKTSAAGSQRSGHRSAKTPCLSKYAKPAPPQPRTVPSQKRAGSISHGLLFLAENLRPRKAHLWWCVCPLQRAIDVFRGMHDNTQTQLAAPGSAHAYAPICFGIGRTPPASRYYFRTATYS